MRPGYFISETNQRMSIKFGTGDQQKRPQMYLLIFVSIGPTTALDEDIREQIPSVSTQVTEEATTHIDIQVTEERYTVDTETSDVSSVFVSHVTSPGEFWIQYASDTSYIEEMENRLLEAKNFPLLTAVVEGAVCAAEFTDGLWYRARVVQVTDGVEVLFFDYGNHSASTELRKLPEDLLILPPLAKCCSLPLLNITTRNA